MRRLLQWTCLAPLQMLLAFSGCTVIFTTGNGMVKSIAVTPANPSVAVGGKQQFTANVTFGDGTTLTFSTSGAFWSTSNPKVATISGAGLAAGVSPGSATITATLQGVSGSTMLTVTATAPAVVVSGSATQLDVAFPPSGTRFLFVANAPEDNVLVYRLDGAGSAGPLVETEAFPPGSAPAWLATDRDGGVLYVANRGSASISAFSINRASGRLLETPGSPFAARVAPFSIAVTNDGGALEVTHFASPAITRLRIASGALLPE